MQRVWLLLICMLLLIAACAPAVPDSAETVAEAPAAVEATGEADADAEVAAVEADAAAETVSETATETATEAPVVDDTAADESMPAPSDDVAAFPATTFEEAAIFRTFDHFKGAEEPIVEIIEYGDFQ